MADSLKTMADQIREIDKLVEDGMDRLAQAHFALRSLEDRMQHEQTRDQVTSRRSNNAAEPN